MVIWRGWGATFSASQLCLASLLGVLQSYQRCLPDAMTDAAFDPGKLLSPVNHPSYPLPHSIFFS